MSFAQQAVQPHVHPLTVVGFFPNGDGYSGTVIADTPIDATVRVLAERRYCEDGGELEISCVLDASGAVVCGDVGRPVRLLSSGAAIFEVVSQVRSDVPLAQAFAARGIAAVSDMDKINAYLELFELALDDAPHCFDRIGSGLDGDQEDDRPLFFTDSLGVEHEIVPADALKVLAEKALTSSWSVAAAQVAQMVSVARSSVNIACLDAVTDY
jgi:hypothetical protein